VIDALVDVVPRLNDYNTHCRTRHIPNVKRMNLTDELKTNITQTKIYISTIVILDKII